MSDVNKERGEVPILLDGKVYPMRPSYEAIQAIEQRHGPILSLVTRLASPVHRLRMDELATIVTETIRAAGKDRDDKMLMSVQEDRIGELLYEHGIAKTVDVLELLLINMITGGGQAKKKESASGKKKKR
jgi:hypothetical protein